MWTKGARPFRATKGGAGAKRQRGMPRADGRTGCPRSRGKCPKDKGGSYQANNQELPPTGRINHIQNTIQIP